MANISEINGFGINAVSASYATTASYALNGGGGGTPSTIDTLNISSNTITWDYSSSPNAQVTLTADVTTFNINNATTASYGLLKVTQDGTGGWDLAAPANSKVINSGSGQLGISTQAGVTDILTFFYDGTTYFWNIGKIYT